MRNHVVVLVVVAVPVLLLIVESMQSRLLVTLLLLLLLLLTLLLLLLLVEHAQLFLLKEHHDALVPPLLLALEHIHHVAQPSKIMCAVLCVELPKPVNAHKQPNALELVLILHMRLAIGRFRKRRCKHARKIHQHRKMHLELVDIAGQRHKHRGEAAQKPDKAGKIDTLVVGVARKELRVLEKHRRNLVRSEHPLEEAIGKLVDRADHRSPISRQCAHKRRENLRSTHKHRRLEHLQNLGRAKNRAACGRESIDQRRKPRRDLGASVALGQHPRDHHAHGLGQRRADCARIEPSARRHVAAALVLIALGLVLTMLIIVVVAIVIAPVLTAAGAGRVDRCTGCLLVLCAIEPENLKHEGVRHCNAELQQNVAQGPAVWRGTHKHGNREHLHIVHIQQHRRSRPCSSGRVSHRISLAGPRHGWRQWGIDPAVRCCIQSHPVGRARCAAAGPRACLQCRDAASFELCVDPNLRICGNARNQARGSRSRCSENDRKHGRRKPHRAAATASSRRMGRRMGRGRRKGRRGCRVKIVTAALCGDKWKQGPECAVGDHG
eukprot:comp5021_c0_seq1/m.4073 comp5021_c0_seq1/g.4073  ORF comp5021_c0_seq1/g.4073 comp5021_c0_seq1/m.4073 type:complete len:551 (-) comp5021_c0_seq1:673-2325(-)